MIELALHQHETFSKKKNKRKEKEKEKMMMTIGYDDNNIHRIRSRREEKTDIIGTVITRPTEAHIHRHRTSYDAMNDAHARR
jgi:hypothetical protein